MVSIHVDLEKLEWRPGSAKYGPVAVHEGKEIIQSAILSDRRQEGGNRRGRPLRRACLQSSRRSRHKIGPARPRLQRLHSELGGTGTQRPYRNRNAEPRYLSRRTGPEYILRYCRSEPGFGDALKPVSSTLRIT